MNIPQIIMLTSISSISSPGWRPSFCRTFEWMTAVVFVVRQSCTNGILSRICNRFPCAGARIYIWLPHLRTRCCVLSRTFGHRLLHTGEIQIWTFFFECPRTVRYTRTQRCWRPVDSLRHQIPHWFRFCSRWFIFSWFFSLYQSFRHGLRQTGWAEMVRWKLCNVYDIEQTQKIIPFITNEIVFRQDVDELVLKSTYLIYFLGSNLILSNNQSSATLWVRNTCLIVGLLPFIIILITASFCAK